MTVEFGPDQTQSLDRLAVELNTTKTAVLRYGLALLAVAIRETKKGNSLGVIRDERVVKQLIGTWDDVTPAA